MSFCSLDDFRKNNPIVLKILNISEVKSVLLQSDHGRGVGSPHAKSTRKAHHEAHCATHGAYNILLIVLAFLPTVKVKSLYLRGRCITLVNGMCEITKYFARFIFPNHFMKVIMRLFEERVGAWVENSFASVFREVHIESF